MKGGIKLVYGVGINDADYVVQIKEIVGYKDNGKIIEKLIWVCPFYVRWLGMLQRCYSESWLVKYPTYRGCSTIPEWHHFIGFRGWMEKQDWEGKQLDKDILFSGNKIYGPEACVFVDQKVNKFFNNYKNGRGKFPIGVCLDKKSGRFKAQGCDIEMGKRKTLGYFDTPEEAHQAWLAFKLEQAYILAAEQTDPRVAKALIDRYENYANLD